MGYGVYNEPMTDDLERAFLRPGEVARASGVSTDTLRHYERKGVLAAPRRSRNGYREYPSSAINRVLLVRGALSMGFTLEELAPILGARDRNGVPCGKVRELAASKLSEVEINLEALKSLRDELRAILLDWDARLAQTPRGERAALLESLASRASAPPVRADRIRAGWRNLGKTGRQR
jgi:DNA-binding transcriptional MerR regulator